MRDNNLSVLERCPLCGYDHKPDAGKWAFVEGTSAAVCLLCIADNYPNLLPGLDPDPELLRALEMVVPAELHRAE